MTRRYSIAEARHNLAAIVHELEQQPVIELTRRGQTVAVLLSQEAYRQLIPGQGEFWAAYLRFCQDFRPAEESIDADEFTDLRDRSSGRDTPL